MSETKSETCTNPICVKFNDLMQRYKDGKLSDAWFEFAEYIRECDHFESDMRSTCARGHLFCDGVGPWAVSYKTFQSFDIMYRQLNQAVPFGGSDAKDVKDHAECTWEVMETKIAEHRATLTAAWGKPLCDKYIEPRLMFFKTIFPFICRTVKLQEFNVLRCQMFWIPGESTSC